MGVYVTSCRVLVQPGGMQEVPMKRALLVCLRRLTSRLNVPRGATFEDCVADGSVIAGTPQRVREALRSLELFASEVMPRLAQL